MMLQMSHDFRERDSEREKKQIYQSIQCFKCMNREPCIQLLQERSAFSGGSSEDRDKQGEERDRGGWMLNECIQTRILWHTRHNIPVCINEEEARSPRFVYCKQKQTKDEAAKPQIHKRKHCSPPWKCQIPDKTFEKLTRQVVSCLVQVGYQMTQNIV